MFSFFFFFVFQKYKTTIGCKQQMSRVYHEKTRYMQKHRTRQADLRLLFRSMHRTNSLHLKFEISISFLAALLK